MSPALVCGAVYHPAGEKRHLTLIVCGNDIHSMTDIGKITDQVCCVCVCVCVCVCMCVCACVDAVFMYSMPGVGCEGVHVDIFMCVNYG